MSKTTRELICLVDRLVCFLCGALSIVLTLDAIGVSSRHALFSIWWKLVLLETLVGIFWGTLIVAGHWKTGIFDDDSDDEPGGAKGGGR